ncbi:hypothetical protein ACH5RR_029403, partial [Cinchona calisaya]
MKNHNGIRKKQLDQHVLNQTEVQDEAETSLTTQQNVKNILACITEPFKSFQHFVEQRENLPSTRKSTKTVPYKCPSCHGLVFQVSIITSSGKISFSQ